eukprot:2349940-Rhodomonas_salina.1
MVLHPPYGICGTEREYDATVGVGTELGYGGTCVCLSGWLSVSVCGTELGYGAMRITVLSEGMVLCVSQY